MVFELFSPTKFTNTQKFFNSAKYRRVCKVSQKAPTTIMKKKVLNYEKKNQK